MMSPAWCVRLWLWASERYRRGWGSWSSLRTHRATGDGVCTAPALGDPDIGGRGGAKRQGTMQSWGVRALRAAAWVSTERGERTTFGGKAEVGMDLLRKKR